MVKLLRSADNPILRPNKSHAWEVLGAFNGCPVKVKNRTYLLFRALSKKKKYKGVELELSTIGIAESGDGIHFGDHRQLIVPEYEWEQYGCEDPRVTYINGTYYIFYTALSTFPFNAAGIRIGLATTRDFKTFKKHPITPFNAKAMTMFPQKINGKYTVLLTANTDTPPPAIAVAQADHIEDFWNDDFWDEWYMFINSHTLPLLRSYLDHLEVGAPPILTKAGWVLFYSYIKDYQTSMKVFGIEALLLDEKNPMKIKGAIKYPLLEPKMPYEKKGIVPSVTFPSGALLEKDTISVYYGAADTVCAVATLSVKELLAEFR